MKTLKPICKKAIFNQWKMFMLLIFGILILQPLHSQEPLNVWKYTEHSSLVIGVAVDDDSYVYTASYDREVHKIAQNGNLEWKYPGHGSLLSAVDVDVNGYVYSASYGNEIHKIGSPGNYVWAYTEHTNYVQDVTVDNKGYVYSASNDNEVHKIDPSGNFVWAYTGHSGAVRGVAVDADGYVYSTSNDDEVHKIDPSGDFVWAYTEHSNSVLDVAVDADGYVYSASFDNEVHKIDPSGNFVWAYTEHSDGISGVAVDEDGYVYSASRDDEVHKIDPSGNQVWAYTGHSDRVFDVAVDADGYVYSASRDDEVHKILELPLNGPIQKLPSDNETETLLAPKFQWNEVTSAETYQIQISERVDLAHLVIEEDALEYTEYSPDEELEEGTLYFWRVRAIHESGDEGEWSETWSFETKVDNATNLSEIITEDFNLTTNPNPFTQSTTIQYTLPEASDIQIELFNLAGEKIKTLSKSHQSKGDHSMRFNAGDLPGGIYIIKLEAIDRITENKLLLLN